MLTYLLTYLFYATCLYDVYFAESCCNHNSHGEGTRLCCFGVKVNLRDFFDNRCSFVRLTLSPLTPLRLSTLPYWSNAPVLIFDIRALWRTLALSPERQSARMSKIKTGGLDQYGAGSFEEQQFGTVGVEGVKIFLVLLLLLLLLNLNVITTL